MQSPTDPDILPCLRRARQASLSLAAYPDEQIAGALRAIADAIGAHTPELLEANTRDLARMDPASPLADRLRLTPERLADIADGLRQVADLPCPVGEVLEDRLLYNGIRLRKVRCPYGVIGVVYEARPNVTFDVMALCLRTRNACVLKGGSDARCSNEAAAELIHRVMREHGLDPEAVQLLPPTHEATAAMLGATGLIDLCIPRGGRGLINMVRDTARVPVIETGAGVVHCYVHSDAPLDMAARIVDNAKTRRVSVCNALDTLLVNASRLPDLPALTAPLAEKGVAIYADPRAFEALAGHYPEALLHPADTDTVWDTEWMDYRMGLRTVDTLDEALTHIRAHGSGHSESIVTDPEGEAAARFRHEVDAACVYVNAPTSFTDGAQFGLGAEIGISTQKLGPRGPMGLRELTTYRYILDGEGQTRS